MFLFFSLLCSVLVGLFFLATFVHYEGSSQPLVYDASFHGLLFGKEVFSLGYPLVLNATSAWSYDIDHPSPGPSLFTDIHIITSRIDRAPVCYTLRSTLKSVCETEERRQYFLPVARVVGQRSSCHDGICTTTLTVPLPVHPAIPLHDAKSSLRTLLALRTRAPPAVKLDYRLTYNFSRPVDFSWKPVHLQVFGTRTDMQTRANSTFQYDFAILAGSSQDSIFTPIRQEKIGPFLKP